MITLFMIIAIVILCVSAKKKKHDTVEDQTARIQYPSFSIKSKPMGTVSKIVNLALSKSELLDSISYNGDRVFIRTQDGKELHGELSNLLVEFEKIHGLIYYRVKSEDVKIKFYQTTNISSDEWTIINGLLCLAGTTRGEYIFDKVYKGTNAAAKAIKLLNKL